jgi:hypothetical protein
MKGNTVRQCNFVVMFLNLSFLNRYTHTDRSKMESTVHSRYGHILCLFFFVESRAMTWSFIQTTPTHISKLIILQLCVILSWGTDWEPWQLSQYSDYVTDWTTGVLGFDSRRGLRIFLFTTVSRPALSHPASYPIGNRGSSPGNKAAGARSWPFTSIYCRGKRMRGAIPSLPQHAFIFTFLPFRGTD